MAAPGLAASPGFRAGRARAGEKVPTAVAAPGLAARRAQNFELSQEEFDRLLLEPLDDWTRRPRLEVLARFFRALPGTFAQRQRQDVLPRTEANLLAFGAYLELQEEEVVGRQNRIEEIQAEIDERAWELYRFRTTPPDTHRQ